MLATHSIEIANLPARQFVPMEAQPLVPWTPARMIRAALEWVIVEIPQAAVQPVKRTVS